MTETEIRELIKQAVLERWKNTKSTVVVGLSHQVIKLGKELADEKFSNIEIPPSIPSIKTIKEYAWLAFIEAYDKKDRDNASITESEEAGHNALDKYLEKLKNVDFKEDTQGEKTEKIDWEAGLAELTFMFEILFKNEEIGCSMKQYKKRWALIAKHFTVKGEDITSEGLRHAFSQLKYNKMEGKPKDYDIYEKLLELAKEMKD